MEKFIWEQDTYRYVLGTVGKKPLVFIGLNPSTAIPKHPDATYRRLTKLLETSLTKFDSIILLNLCPFVATKPDKLPNDISTYHHKRNLAFIEEVLSECCETNKELNILLAWGSGIYNNKAYFKKVLEDLKTILGKYKTYTNFYYVESKNKLYPHHPLAFQKDIKLTPNKDLPEEFFNIACGAKYD